MTTQNQIERSEVESVLRGWMDPVLGKDYVSLGMVGAIEGLPGGVKVRIDLGYPQGDRGPWIAESLESRLRQELGLDSVRVEVVNRIVSHAVQKNLKPLQGIKNIIAVASGKGGVGKSTTAINLAAALSQAGANTGILDADIYGPSVPHMLGIAGKPKIDEAGLIHPHETLGLKVMSIGFLVEEDQAMIWRGPMVTGALQQLLNQTLWGDLDYLVIDLPPGTGDIQLSLSQQIPVSGALIVTTPQDIALLDAQRGLAMFHKVGIPVLGLVENMSVHVCSNCGHIEPLFGSGGGARLSGRYDLELLAELPLDLAIREQSDAGKPLVLALKDHPAAEIYRSLAQKTSARLAMAARDYRSSFPKITVSYD